MVTSLQQSGGLCQVSRRDSTDFHTALSTKDERRYRSRSRLPDSLNSEGTMWDFRSKPFPLREEQLIIDQPFCRPGNNGLVKIVASLPRLRGWMVKAKPAVCIHVNLGIRRDRWPDHMDFGDTPQFVSNADGVRCRFICRSNVSIAFQHTAIQAAAE